MQPAMQPLSQRPSAAATAHVRVGEKERRALGEQHNALATANTCERRRRPHICAVDRQTPPRPTPSEMQTEPRRPRQAAVNWKAKICTAQANA